MSMNRERLAATAHHEAGHYVAHYCLGDESVHGLTIVPHGDAAGLTHGEYPLPEEPTPKQIRTAVICSYAGFAAAVHFGQDEAAARAAAASDDEQADDFLRMLHGDDEEALRATEAELRAEARTIVETNFYGVQVLAGCLLECKRLDKFEADSILDFLAQKEDAAECVAKLFTHRWESKAQRARGQTGKRLPPLLARWSKQLEALHNELFDFSTYQQVFAEVGEIIQANPELKDPNFFYDLLITSFGHYCIAAVRRLVDKRDDVFSLMGVLLDVERHAQAGVITRAAWVEWALKRTQRDPDDSYAANHCFNLIAGKGSDSLSPDRVREDIERLTAATNRIVRFGHTHVAHRARSPEPGELKFAEINDAMVEVRRVFEHYSLLASNTNISGQVSVYGGWQCIFEIPWIRLTPEGD